MTHGVTGIDWKHYKHPLPENVFDVVCGFGAAPGATGIYIVGFCALWLCLGGWLAIAPACTAAFCGTKYYGPNYGLVFTAYGAGAIAGNLLAGQLRDLVGSSSLFGRQARRVLRKKDCSPLDRAPRRPVRQV